MIAFTKADHRIEIDGLRTIAVLCVVLYHLGIQGLRGGFVGVDIFFVISGFLITGKLAREFTGTGRIDLAAFYAGRIRRLFPALLVTVAISFIASLIILGPTQFAQFSGSAVHSLVWLSNFFFWAEAGYFDASGATKPLLHTWSLSVEEQFYLLWPFLLIVAYKVKGKSWPLVVFLAAGGLSLVANYLVFLPSVEWMLQQKGPVRHFFENAGSSIFFLTPFRIFEFAIGAVCFWAANAVTPRGTTRTAVQLVGLLTIAGSVMFINETFTFPGVTALAPCIGTGLVIWAGGQTIFRPLFANHITREISLISYSIYLVHWPLIVLYKQWTLKDLTHTEIGILFAVTIILAEILARMIEIPIWKRKILVDARPSTIGLAAALAALVAIIPISNSWATGGWKWRFDEIAAFDLQGLELATLDYAKANLSAAGFGDGRMRIAVVGDSHGRDTANGLHQNLKLPGYDVQYQPFSNPCLPFLGLPPEEVKRQNGGCAVQINRLERSTKVRDAHLIVISLRWPADPEKSLPSLVNLLKHASKTKNAQILVLGPAVQVRNFQTIARRLLSQGASMDRLNAIDPQLVQYFRRVDSRLAKASKELGVVFESKVDAMCPKDRCELITNDGKLLIWDQQHWTLLGAQIYGKRLINMAPHIFAAPMS